jgi:hypothetical protein
MARRREGEDEQILERIRNALTQLNNYRAKDLDNRRIEGIMTELERIETLLQEEDGWLSASEMRALDFHLLEGTPMERNEGLERELYAIRNYVEHRL